MSRPELAMRVAGSGRLSDAAGKSRNAAMARSAPVAIEIGLNGKTYRGTYTINEIEGMITVTYDRKGKIAQLGGFASAPEALARIMLQELVTKA
jgi:hypothetical protein